MGRTVATYTEAFAEEHARLIGFRRALRKEEQELFDLLWEWARLHTQAGSYLSATSPLVPIIFSILIEAARSLQMQAERIGTLEERLGALEARLNEAS